MSTPTSSNNLSTSGSSPVQIQIGRDPNVAGVKASPASADTSPMGTAYQPTVGAIKPTDFKTLEGSYPGDHRHQPGDTAAASVQRASGSNKAPRSATGQAGA